MYSKLSLMAAAALLAACSSTTPPTASPTGSPTPAPTAAPTASPTAAPTATPTAVPTASPTAVPTAAFTPTELLTRFAHADLRDTCRGRDRIYDAELGSVTCGPADLPFDYSLFGSAADMDAAFDDDVAGAETPPEEGGTCAEANYLLDYDFDGRVGRVNCREHVSSTTGAQYHVIEWTDENLLVIGYISNRIDVHTWDELIDFWLNRAGPYAP